MPPKQAKRAAVVKPAEKEGASKRQRADEEEKVEEAAAPEAKCAPQDEAREKVASAIRLDCDDCELAQEYKDGFLQLCRHVLISEMTDGPKGSHLVSTSLELALDGGGEVTVVGDIFSHEQYNVPTMLYLKSLGAVPFSEVGGAKSVLRWAGRLDDEAMLKAFPLAWNEYDEGMKISEANVTALASALGWKDVKPKDLVIFLSAALDTYFQRTMELAFDL